MRPNLLSWQYEGYAEFHRNRANLLLHIVAVPAVVLAFAALLFGALTLHWAPLAAGFIGMVVSFLVQGIGHQREPTPSIPFAGPGDALSRILSEQFVTFPRFVLSGAFGRALRAAAPSR